MSKSIEFSSPPHLGVTGPLLQLTRQLIINVYRGTFWVVLSVRGASCSQENAFPIRNFDSPDRSRNGSFTIGSETRSRLQQAALSSDSMAMRSRLGWVSPFLALEACLFPVGLSSKAAKSLYPLGHSAVEEIDPDELGRLSSHAADAHCTSIVEFYAPW